MPKYPHFPRSQTIDIADAEQARGCSREGGTTIGEAHATGHLLQRRWMRCWPTRVAHTCDAPQADERRTKPRLSSGVLLSVAATFRLVPVAGLATMLLVFAVTSSSGQLPVWPLQSVSRYGGKYPAVYLFRAVTAVMACLTFQAALLLRRRALAVARALVLAALGLLGLGAVSIYEHPLVHRACAVTLFASLVTTQVSIVRRARAHFRQDAELSDPAASPRAAPPALFRPGAIPPVRTLSMLLATVPVLMATVVGFGAAGRFYDAWGAVETSFLAQSLTFLMAVAPHLSADEVEAIEAEEGMHAGGESSITILV